VEPLFQNVLGIGVPGGAMRLRPEIADVVVASQAGSDQIIQLVVACVARGNTVFFKNFPAL